MSDRTAELHLGDCLDVLAGLPAESVDTVVTDPPYSLPGGFMGKRWDRFDGREDVGFGYYLSGFIDGEGCFRVQRHERGTHTCTFSMKLRRDDSAILVRAHRELGIGTLTESTGKANPLRSWVVQDKAGCEALVGFLRRFPLRAKKRLDFEEWAEAVGEWLSRPRGNRWSGAADQSAASSLKARVENCRDYRDVPWSGHPYQDRMRIVFESALRVAKPGAMLLAFGGTRTSHRLACAIEDAGWEIRDTLMWLFGSGFPKSLDISKALDREAGADLARTWQGYGTALKPAYEPIIVAMKPLDGTFANNAREHGVAGLWVDGGRVGTDAGWNYPNGRGGSGWHGRESLSKNLDEPIRAQAGRFPANLILDERAAEVLDGEAGDKVHGAGFARPETERSPRDNGSGVIEFSNISGDGGHRFGDSGGPSRFFYTAKTSTAERHGSDGAGGTATTNRHPTVKPVDLMQYLCRLTKTPTGGVVLDPFMGSGSTGIAALREGRAFIGIEREREYFDIARERIAADAPLFNRVECPQPRQPEDASCARPSPPAGG